MNKSFFGNSVATIFGLSLLMLLPASAFADLASSGIQVCGGDHFQRPSQNETHTTRYTLRNFNTGESIAITRIVVVDGNGSFLFDGLPSGTFKPTLAAFQSTQFDSNSVIGSFLPEASRPIQTYILWHTVSGNTAQRLDGSFVHLTRDSSSGKEITRHNAKCEDLN